MRNLYQKRLCNKSRLLVIFADITDPSCIRMIQRQNILYRIAKAEGIVFLIIYKHHIRFVYADLYALFFDPEAWLVSIPEILPQGIIKIEHIIIFAIFRRPLRFKPVITNGISLFINLVCPDPEAGICFSFCDNLLFYPLQFFDGKDGRQIAAPVLTGFVCFFPVMSVFLLLYNSSATARTPVPFHTPTPVRHNMSLH